MNLEQGKIPITSLGVFGKGHICILDAFALKMPVIPLLFHPVADRGFQLLDLGLVLRSLGNVIELPWIFLEIEELNLRVLANPFKEVFHP